MSEILIIEDDRNICWAFQEYLRDNGHQVVVTATAEEGLAHLEQKAADVVLLDVRLPGMNGLDALEEIRRRSPKIPVVVMTAYGRMEIAVRSIQRGAYEYLTKPIDLDEANRVISRALASRNTLGATPAVLENGETGELLGIHPLMQEVFKQIGALSQSEVNVLIQGSSGTGKELVARAIHDHSPRSKRPFVPIDCARLPDGLAESELFGHERGAFTGAVERQVGQFERAHGGTVLLDEVGDLSGSHQKKLLRFLEERSFERVGGNEPVKTDVRILAATHRPLDRLVEAGSFREDLFYRLNVVSLRLPDLRERKEDVPLLASYFLRQAAPQKTLSPATLSVLQSYSWPGNVRELRNAIQHASVLARTHSILPDDLPTSVTGKIEPAGPTLDSLIQKVVDEALAAPANDRLYEELMRRFEGPVVQRVFEFTGHNLARTARILGLHRATLRKKMRQHNLR